MTIAGLQIPNWAIFNTLLTTAIVAGVGFEIQGAYYVAVFLAWAMIIFPTLVLTFSEKDFPTPHTPRPLRVALKAFYILGFVWHGAFFTGSCLLAAVALIEHERHSKEATGS